MIKFIYKLLLIKEGEATPLLHFWFIFMLTLGIGLAFGRASSDALFLSRYGIEYLPMVYIALAPLLAVISILYAALVDSLPSERFFKIILTGLIIIVFFSWILMSQTDNTYIYPLYYIVNKIASELLTVHGSLYLVHNFNTLQAKRLFPLIFTGEQLGTIIGSLLVPVSLLFIGTHDLLLLWVGLMVISILQLYFWHKYRGGSPYFHFKKSTQSKLKVAAQSVYQGLTFTRDSSLLRNASLALFFLVIIYYILSYSTNRIFVESFDNEQELARFLGLFTAAVSVITLSFQIFLTNRVIDRFGIRKLNLVFPLALASASLSLLVSFTLSIAIIAGIIRDSLLNSLQNPIRIIFFNALPGYMQGRAGAVSIAVVMPVALMVCGALLWGIQHLDHINYFLVPCLLLALAFFYYNYKMNQTYTKTLTTNLKEHLYLPGSGSSNAKIDLDEDAYKSLQQTFDELPQARTLTASLLATHYPEKSIDFIVSRIDDMSPYDIDIFLNSLFQNSSNTILYSTLSKFPLNDAHVNATFLKLLTEKNYPEAITIALKNIDSASTRIKSIAAYTLLKNKGDHINKAIKAWEDLLEGDKYSQLSSLTLTPLLTVLDSDIQLKLSERIRSSLEDILKDKNIEFIARAIKLLPQNASLLNQPTILNCIKRLSAESDPELRLCATYGLKLLTGDTRYQTAYKLLNDSHDKVRNNALQNLDIDNKDKDHILNTWLLDGVSSPRVQSTILEKVINEELISHEKLSIFALNRALDANNYSTALNVINKNADETTPLYNLLRFILIERKIQLIDLALQALTPMCAQDQIPVIRAGIISKDAQHIANACEILNNIEKQPAAEILETLIQDNVATNFDKRNHIEITSKEDVILWAVSLSDQWVSYIANIVRGTDMTEDNSRNLIERIALLKQSDIFSEVPTDDLLFVARELEEVKYFSGDHVFDINEFGDKMYFIINGKIGISISPDPEAKDFIVELGSGSSFGEMNLLDNMPRSATAHVLEETFLLTLEKNKLLGLIKSYPDLSMGILRALSYKVRENHMRNIELKAAINS